MVTLYVAIVTLYVTFDLYALQLEVPLSDDKRAHEVIRSGMFNRYKRLFNNSLEVVRVEQGGQRFPTMPFKDYLSILQHVTVE